MSSIKHEKFSGTFNWTVLSFNYFSNFKAKIYMYTEIAMNFNARSNRKSEFNDVTQLSASFYYVSH